MNIRKSALELLNKYEEGGQYVNLSLASHSLDGISIEERRLLTSLLYTAVEKKITYDYYISSLGAREITKIDPVTKNILRLGLCQILEFSSVPDFAAVNETVKLARNPGERSFVNGLLRAAVKKKAELPLPDKDKKFPRYLSVKYSFPLPTVKLFISLYGEEEAEKLLDYYNNEKYTDLLVNTERMTVEELLSELSGKGLKAEVSCEIENSVRIYSPFAVESISSFGKGGFLVQDIASTLAVSALSPRKGERLVDVCSAPGGKSMCCAIMMKNDGEIFSFDLHESKLSLIERSRDRLGLDIIKVNDRDARYPDERLLGTADKVLCDVPCSGLGVLGKKPDLRYKDVTDTEELASLQYEILTSSVKYLKVGGELLYSTCTLNPLENEAVVDRFLKENPEYQALDFKTGSFESASGKLTLVPHKTRSDGFFMAKIKRLV